MSEAKNKHEKLAAAANALVEAACLEADTMTQKKLELSLDSLKNSFDSKIDTLVQSLQAPRKSDDQNINGLKTELADMRVELKSIKSLLEDQKKQKTLETAIQLAHIGSFSYYEKNYANQRNSSELVKTIFQLFSLGCGHQLPEGSLVNVYRSDENHYKAFREKIVSQVKTLIRKDPRLENESGKYTIYYS